MRAKKIAKNPIDIDSKIFNNFKPAIVFLFDINNKKEYYIQELKKSGKEEQIIKQANKICNHIFNLLGSRGVNLGKDIKWNEDFKTDYCLDLGKYYRDIEIPQGKAGIEIPWELSRFQHLVILGKAYWITNRSRQSDMSH